MVRVAHLCLAVLAMGVTACSGDADDAGAKGDNIVRATLVGADQAQYGAVILATGDDGLLMRINAEGLSEGQHGVHIHSIGKCEGPDFKSAGGHWNPEEKQHGFDNPEGSHKGDFYNLDIGADGKGSLEATITGVSLKGEGNALLDADGAAFVVHAGPDDLLSDPSGESGGRIACGVFEGY